MVPDGQTLMCNILNNKSSHVLAIPLCAIFGGECPRCRPVVLNSARNVQLPRSQYGVTLTPACLKHAEYCNDGTSTTPTSKHAVALSPPKIGALSSPRAIRPAPGWHGRQTTITQDNICIAIPSANLTALCSKEASLT